MKYKEILKKRALASVDVQFPIDSEIKYYFVPGNKGKGVSGKELYRLAKLLKALSHKDGMKMNKARLVFDDKGQVAYAHPEWDKELQTKADKATTAKYRKNLKEELTSFVHEWGDLGDPNLLKRDLYVKKIIGDIGNRWAILGDKKDPKWTSKQLAGGTFDTEFDAENLFYNNSPFYFHAY